MQWVSAMVVAPVLPDAACFVVGVVVGSFVKVR